MERSLRVVHRNVFGRKWFNHNWTPITKNSAVLVTAAEWAPGTDAVGRAFLGSATIRVTNVGPHDDEGGGGGVEFCVHVEYDQPLNVQVTITMFDPVEQFVHT